MYFNSMPQWYNFSKPMMINLGTVLQSLVPALISILCIPVVLCGGVLNLQFWLQLEKSLCMLKVCRVSQEVRWATCNVLLSLVFCKCISHNHVKTKTLVETIQLRSWVIKVIISCNNPEPVKPQESSQGVHHQALPLF